MDYRLVGREIAEKLMRNARAGGLKKIDIDVIREAIFDHCGDDISARDLDWLETTVTCSVVELCA